MKVTYFQNGNGACDWYRAVLPIETAHYYGYLKAKKLWPQNIIVNAEENQNSFNEAMESDIFFFQRVIGDKFIENISKVIRKHSPNAKLIMDQDDNIFEVNPLSNHYVDFGTKEFKIESNGKLVFEWKDGVNIDLKANREKIEIIKRGIEKFDMITVTTDHLAEVYRQYNENVCVLPNCVDIDQWHKPKFLRDNKDEVRIVWSGGHSHWEDLYIIRNVLKEIILKNKNAKLIVCGYLPEGMKDDYPEGQFEFHKWTDVSAHPFRMALLDPDIAVIPLKDNEFNRCKSPIKWIEMAALKVPAVSSLVTPYKELISLSENDNGVFIEDNEEESWIKGIQDLIDNKAMRETIALNAHNVVENYYSVNTQYHQWVNTFSEVLTCRSQVAQH